MQNRRDLALSEPTTGVYAARSARLDDGFTLIELLIAMVVMGLAITAVIGGIITLVTVSGAHRTQANVTGVMESAAEVIKSDAYTPCASVSYSITGLALPHDIPVANVIQTITVWNGSSFVSPNLLPTCVSSGLDKGLQEIVLSVKTTDSQPATGKITIVKGNP
jgi:prepilin-type N-terminal cleavage/methylation domain-containing protein